MEPADPIRYLNIEPATPIKSSSTKASILSSSVADPLCKENTSEQFLYSVSRQIKFSFLNGQSNEIFDLQFFSSFKISLSYSNFYESPQISYSSESFVKICVEISLGYLTAQSQSPMCIIPRGVI